jgi:hypothetical protein
MPVGLPREAAPVVVRPRTGAQGINLEFVVEAVVPQWGAQDVRRAGRGLVIESENISRDSEDNVDRDGKYMAIRRGRHRFWSFVVATTAKDNPLGKKVSPSAAGGRVIARINGP